jgi:hypothetical protein
MWLTDKFVSNPCSILTFGLVFILFLGYICVTVGYFDLDERYIRDFMIWDDEKTISYDMQQVAREYIEKFDGAASKPIRTQSVSLWNTLMLYENSEDKHYGLMSLDNLKRIQDVETMIKDHKDWPNFCKATNMEDESCHPKSIVSALSLF